MFTGIIETTGTLVSLRKDRENTEFGVRSDFSRELKIDQSVAHDGVCLTVTKTEGDVHFVTAIAETLSRTNLQSWELGKEINLERCMKADGRFDGHIVQGHVDQIGTCLTVEEKGGSWQYWFEYQEGKGNFTVEKGSICINGISLTVVDSLPGKLSVAIIPYTYEHTNLKNLKKNSLVNLEFDVIGKYIRKLFEMNRQY